MHGGEYRALTIINVIMNKRNMDTCCGPSQEVNIGDLPHIKFLRDFN